MCVRITKDEADGGEEVTLSRPIAPNDHIMFWRERLDNSLILVAAVKIQLVACPEVNKNRLRDALTF